MSERENVLQRIREALSQPTLAVHGNGNHSADFRDILPRSGDAFEERLELFRKTATDLKADFHLVKSLNKAAALLVELRDAEEWKKAAWDGGSLADTVCQSLSLPLCRTDRPYDAQELESCAVGITGCDALVAQTGSVLLTSRSAGGRAVSVLPPHHVVLARKTQLVADLPEALALIKRQYAPDYPSFISFITGPSRTGDIERILVLGAHGPKKLTVILLESE